MGERTPRDKHGERERAAPQETERARHEELQACIARARSSWPAVELDDETFLEFVRERVTSDATIDPARADDLWLACACTQGDDGAIRALDARYATMLHASVLAAVKDDDIASEALQRVRARLFTSTPEHPTPRIAAYAGRGELAAWLRATAIREAIDIARARKPTDELDDQISGAAIEDDPELTFLKHTYRAQFRDAFDHAFAELDLRQRRLLRMKYLDRASIDAIARLHGTHRSTAARWIAEIRARLMDLTRARLFERAGLTQVEFASVVRLIASQLELSIEAKLRGASDE